MASQTISVTTDGSGAGNTTIDVGVPKLLYAVEYDKGTFDNGIDAVLSKTGGINGADRTLLTLTNADADAFHYLRIAETDNVGAALTTGTIPLVWGTMKLTVTAGGAAKTGGVTLHFIEL